MTRFRKIALWLRVARFELSMSYVRRWGLRQQWRDTWKLYHAILSERARVEALLKQHPAA